MTSRWTQCLLAVSIAGVLTGCQAAGEKKGTPKEQAVARWNSTRSSIMLGVARDQFLAGNLDKAREVITEASTLDPKNIELMLLSAQIHIEKAQLEEAEAELDRARETVPQNAKAEYLRGVIYQRWQRPQQAYESYAAAAALEPNELAYLLAAAEMLVTLDRVDEAVAALQGRITFFENSPVIRHALGQLLLQQKQYDQAIDMLRSATVLAPEELMMRENLAMAMFYAGRYRESAEVLARLTREEGYSTRADLLGALGQCYLQLERPLDARAAFENATIAAPGQPEGWINLGKVAIESGDIKRAEIAVRKAIALAPTDPQANLLMGYVRLERNRLPEALAAFRKAAEADPRDATALCMTGYVLEKMGRTEQAVDYYARALAVAPDDELARSLMASIGSDE